MEVSFMESKTREFISKLGKVTLPTMMLVCGTWNLHASVFATKEQISEKDAQHQKSTAIQEVNDVNAILVQQSWNFEGSCYGCEGSCGGCTGACTGCAGGCAAGCTGCMGTCEGSSKSDSPW